MTAFPGGRRGALALLLLLVFAFALQGSRALYAPDEGRYTDVALQMVESGDWLHPQLAPGVPHYTKPPLTYWAVAAALRLGGENTWAARAPNALAFVGAVLMVWRLGRRFVPEQPWQPALIYAVPIGPRKPAFADSAVPPSSHHDAKRILREVATKWGVSVTDIVSDRRSKIVVSARHEACYRLRHETTWSLPRIGGFLGGRDHTTALHGVRKHAERLGLQG